MPKERIPAPLEYADIRVAADGSVLIAVDEVGLTETDTILIKKNKGHVYLLQQGRVRVNIPVPLTELYDRIAPETEILVAQVDDAGGIQVFDKIEFK